MTDIKNLKKISLKNHPEVTESYVQKQISENPDILNMGELIVRDKERKQPGAGRIDLLLEEVDSNRRYEVELQLGQSDESHIIRTIEYWDIERKRYPQYDHVAMLIAEDITSRFLNVIHLLNGNIPIIALQLEAYEIGDEIGISFSKIVDELNFGLIDDDEDSKISVDRNYWVEKATAKTVKRTDKIFKIIKEIDDMLELNYNKHYIGLLKNNKANNFVRFRPRKKHVQLQLKLEKSEEIDEKIEVSGIEELDYDSKRGVYRLQIYEEDLEKNQDFLKDVLKRAYENWSF